MRAPAMAASEERGTDSGPDSVREDKGEFRKISVTIPPQAFERLMRESARRKIAGAPNKLLSAIVREALTAYLERLEQ